MSALGLRPIFGQVSQDQKAVGRSVRTTPDCPLSSEGRIDSTFFGVHFRLYSGAARVKVLQEHVPIERVPKWFSGRNALPSSDDTAMQQKLLHKCEGMMFDVGRCCFTFVDCFGCYNGCIGQFVLSGGRLSTAFSTFRQRSVSQYTSRE